MSKWPKTALQTAKMVKKSAKSTPQATPDGRKGPKQAMNGKMWPEMSHASRIPSAGSDVPLLARICIRPPLTDIGSPDT